MIREIDEPRRLEKEKLSQKKEEINQQIKQIVEKQLPSLKFKYSKKGLFVSKKNIEKQIEAAYSLQEQLEEEVKGIDKELKVSHIYTMDELKEYSKEKNEPIILNEEDLSLIRNLYKPMKSVDDLYLVHKGGHYPVDGKIRCTDNLEPYEYSINIGNDKITSKINGGRGTVHFSVNHEVASHMAGDWDKKPYIVIIPFKDVPIDTIGSALEVDTFVLGDVKLTENTYIICPKEDIEKVQKANPECSVIGFENNKKENKSAKGYGNSVLNLLGVSVHMADQHSYRDYNIHKQYNEIISDLHLSTEEHVNTEYAFKDKYKFIIQVIQMILDYYTNNIEKAVEIDELGNGVIREDIKKSLDMYVGSSITVGFGERPDYKLLSSYIVPSINKDLAKYNIHIDNDPKFRETKYFLYAMKEALNAYLENEMITKSKTYQSYKDANISKLHDNVKKIVEENSEYFRSVLDIYSDNINNPQKESLKQNFINMFLLYGKNNPIIKSELIQNIPKEELIKILNDVYIEYNVYIPLDMNCSNEELLSKVLPTSLLNNYILLTKESQEKTSNMVK